MIRYHFKCFDSGNNLVLRTSLMFHSQNEAIALLQVLKKKYSRASMEFLQILKSAIVDYNNQNDA